MESSDRWTQIEDLYEATLRLDPSERVAFLERACADDEQLFRQLHSLVAAAEQEDSFLQEPIFDLGMSLLALETAPAVGEMLGPYRLLELLGRGGMGRVYLAHDPRLNRRVALKLLPGSLTGDHERVQRFLLEARADAAVIHPNVAHIYEASEDRGWHFITMEYIAGRTLRQVLKQGTPDLLTVVDIAAQVLSALAAAHDSGVIHRDIKPENIMVMEEGYIKVLDFGLAKLVEGGGGGAAGDDALPLSSLHTQPELMAGTPHYMSPEQVRRQPVDGRTDIWSLGVVLYEMLTGRRPFTGRHGGAFGEVIAILEDEPAPVESGRPDLPPALCALVLKALQKPRAQRYQSAREMLADLREVRRQLPAGEHAPPRPVVNTMPPGGAETNLTWEAPATEPPDVPSPSSGFLASLRTYVSGWSVSEEPGGTSKPPRWWWLALAALLLAVTGGGLYLKHARGEIRVLQSAPLNLRFERLSLSGRIDELVVSPDGKYVAAVVESAGGQALRITEVATASELLIVPRSEHGYGGLSFSPDGNYIYYFEKEAETANLYRTSKLGGGGRKILDNVNTPVTFSPDGSLIAFVRFNIKEDTPDLVVARADGDSPRTLARCTGADADVFPVDLSGPGPSWSPDGRLLALPTVSVSRSPKEMNVEVLSAEDGQRRRLNARPWYDISRVAWLADGSGLLVAGAESAGDPTQLSLLSYPSGEFRRVTNDPNNYRYLSATADSVTLLALNVEEGTSVWHIPREGAATAVEFGQRKEITDVAHAPDGRLIYTARDGDNMNIWAQDGASEPPRQLTFKAGKSFRPTASPDGRFIVFASSGAGRVNLWRIDADGTHPKQLTAGPYEDMPAITPDGRWVIYRTGSGVQKVSIDGGDPVNLFNRSTLYPVVSPDGRLLACLTSAAPDSGRWELEVLDLGAPGKTQRTPLPETAVPFSGLAWTPDGKGLTYVATEGGAANLWTQPLAGGSPIKITDFKEDDILSFAWSADGVTCLRNVKTYAPVFIKPF